MIFLKHIPGPPLNNYVDCIIYIEGNNKGVGFPKTAMSLAFNLNETVNEKFVVTENFLCRKLLKNKIPNGKLLSSIDLLFKRKGNISIKEVCRQHNISRKHLNFLFHEYLGISPKMLSSLNRFQSILHSISKSSPGKLTNIAYELDFFDQAHFNNNFKRFTGLKPNDYIKTVATKPTLKIVHHFLPVG